VKHPDGCGSDDRTVRLHIRTLAACHMLMWQRTFGRVSDPSGRGPHRLYLDAHTLAVALPLYLTRFSMHFCPFEYLFLAGFCIISAYIVLLCIFLSIPGTFSVLFILFSVLLTVRILNLLGNVLRL
jgi:hypothetical protein